MARSNKGGRRFKNWFTRRPRRRSKSHTSLRLESLESRVVLDASGFPGNDCPPDLDLSGVAEQQVLLGQPISFNLLTEGGTVTDLDEMGDPTGDNITLMLDPDSPDQTPSGASLTADGDFTWTPAEGQVGTFTFVVIAVDEGTPPLADAETFTVVVSSNQAPVVDLNGPDAGIDFAAMFTEDGGAVAAVDSAELAVTDTNDANIESATATITNLADGISEVLAVDTTGTSITAMYDDATGVLTLTGSDTLANYQQVLRSLTYENTSQDPTEGDRTIEVQVNDGMADSAAATSTVTVVAENDLPNLTLPAPFDDPGTPAEITQGLLTEFTVTVTDVDHELSEIIFQVDTDGSGLPEGATLPTIDQDGNFSWTPDVAGAFSFFIIAVDAEGGSDPERTAITVVVDDVAPFVISAPSGTLDSPITFIELTFSEQMGAAALVAANYTLEIVGGPNNGQEVTIDSVTSGDNQTVSLNFSTALDAETYQLTLDDTLLGDLSGNLLSGTSNFGFTVQTVP